MEPELFWIPGLLRGRMAIVTRPRGGDWLEDEAGGWQRAGLDAIVSLLEPDEAAQLGLLTEASAAGSAGVQFIQFPIEDRGIPESASAAVSLFRGLAEMVDSGKSIAIHCRQGVGRSGLVAAGVLIVSGLPPDRAIDVISDARGLRIPETPEQLDWIRRLLIAQPARYLTPDRF